MDKKEINDFFVEIFNLILSKEEKFLLKSSYNDISLKEVHVIEAISLLIKEEKNTMTNIANKVRISVGALTTAIKALIRKGYVERSVCKKDQRIIYVLLTKKGEDVLKTHELFHEKMLDYILKTNSKEELEKFLSTLNSFKTFFNQI